MHLNVALECVASFPKSEDLTQFVHDIAPEWIEEALAATGTATLRRRRLPMEQVPWLHRHGAAARRADHGGGQQARLGDAEPNETHGGAQRACTELTEPRCVCPIRRRIVTISGWPTVVTVEPAGIPWFVWWA
jgi:hypothetical protein